jgi:hypothetical protein
MYRQDHSAAPPKFWARPPDESYYGALQPYVRDKSIWLCPSSNPGPRIQELVSYNYQLDGDREWSTNEPLTPLTVVFYCLNHREIIPRSLAEEQLGLPKYRGVYPIARLDSSAERLEASKIKVTEESIPGTGALVSSRIEVLAFPK